MQFKLIKKQSKKTYKNKAGKEVHYYNYYIVVDNGTSIQIKASFPSKDNARLDCISTYER